MTSRPVVVAIGASAGGVEALSTLFQGLPSQPNAAFIVVTHLARDRKSLLPEIIARFATMPVAVAQDGQAVEGGRVYLNPPEATLTLCDGHLALRPRDSERHPIDVLLTSVATDIGEDGVGVILSGTGNDGAIGIKALREAGGFTLAQGVDGSATGHSDMPDAAIATGFVDRVAPIDELSALLAAYLRNVAENGMHGDRILNGDRAALDQARQEIHAVIRHRTGHEFGGYKDKTFFRRIERRMQVRQLSDLSAYVDLIKHEPDEAVALFRDLLIGVTNFFRDREAFDQLEKLVIPHLFERKGAAEVVRAWVPGCATGEEAYSLAMLLCEGAEKAHVQPRIQIFATDINEKALAVARAGRYPEPLLNDLPTERLGRFFTHDGNAFTVTRQLRDICVFSAHSLIRDPPFSRIDLISCRNVLIYFTTDLQDHVAPLFHYALRPGGYLFLGASENLSQHSDLFTPLDKKRRIFQRRDPPSPPASFPLLPRPGDGAAPSKRPPALFGGHDSVRLLERRVLDEFAPAHVMVNQDGDVVHYSARTGKYFEAPAGAPSRNLLSLARKGLRLPLRMALQQAHETGRRSQCRNVTFELDGRLQTVDLAVDPLSGFPQNYWLIVFTDIDGNRAPDEAAGEITPQGDEILRLERELQETRERLQSSVEDYETSVEELRAANEEMLSINEELQSSNEEMETSKEELQSVNEELHTVNSELSAKVDELNRANDDLRNLFDSTRIATVFLDRSFAVRNFTPAMTEIFKLIPSDRGRPLSDIVSLIDYQGLEDDVRNALTHPVPVEKSVSRRDGSAHYLMRIVPYLAADAHVEGVIVTFVNVTEIIRAEEHQRLLVAELNHRVKNTLAVVASLAKQLARRSTTIQEFSEGLDRRIRGLAMTHDLLSVKEWSSVTLAELLAAEISAFVTDPSRVAGRGPVVQLKPRAATTIGMVIHEMATNATRHGALSNEHGRVEVAWTCGGDNGNGNGSQDRLVLTWREIGGPPVQRPTTLGLGSELIERSLDFELGGAAVTEYREDGIVVTLTIPVEGHHIMVEGNGGS